MTKLAYDEEGLVDKKHYFLPGEEFVEQTIPVFKYERILNQNRYIDEGRPVVDIREVVELRFAQNTSYSPVFPVEATLRTINVRVLHSAERPMDMCAPLLSRTPHKPTRTPLQELHVYWAHTGPLTT